MSDTALYQDLLLVTIAAFVGGAVAQMLRLPTIIGFLVAGVLIGPGTPGPVGDIENIGRAADIGVILLMFSIGIQFSIRQLLENKRVIFLGGGLQITLTMVLGVMVGRLIGLGWAESFILGFFAPQTSTVVSSKVLEARGETHTLPAFAAVNISILQDLSSVVLVIAVPSLAGGALAIDDIGFAIVKGIALVAVTFALATYVLPGVWRRIAHTRSRELALLAALSLAIGFASGSAVLGLSVAFGAFLAGIAVSENSYGYSTLSDIIPLREIFASVFFVLVGMLIDPEVIWQEPGTVFAIVFVITIAKAFFSTIAVRVVGLALAPAIMSGMILAQVGEFSFVIARVALAADVISADLGSALLAAAMISIIINPALVSIGPRLGEHLTRMRIFAPAPVPTELLNPEQTGELRRHVVICGYGGSAQTLVKSLSGRRLPLVVIDNNPFIYDRVREESPDLNFVYGDATRPEVLELARIRDARVLAVTIPGPLDSQITISTARTLNPSINVVARGTFESHALIREAGANEVIDPEFEASLEFVRHVLHRFGVDAREIGALQARWRAEYYSGMI